jgi:hypothetical protein
VGRALGDPGDPGGDDAEDLHDPEGTERGTAGGGEEQHGKAPGGRGDGVARGGTI